jgi:rRNA pseudouridine-1189 N-methylase Emg1 (Nep1/Mra1 family)
VSTETISVALELERLARVASEIEQRYIAHFALHRAACLHRDPEEMRLRRDQLHTILDTLLDNGESVQKLTDKLTVFSR